MAQDKPQQYKVQNKTDRHDIGGYALEGCVSSSFFCADKFTPKEKKHENNYVKLYNLRKYFTNFLCDIEKEKDSDLIDIFAEDSHLTQLTDLIPSAKAKLKEFNIKLDEYHKLLNEYSEVKNELNYDPDRKNNYYYNPQRQVMIDKAKKDFDDKTSNNDELKDKYKKKMNDENRLKHEYKKRAGAAAEPEGNEFFNYTSSTGYQAAYQLAGVLTFTIIPPLLIVSITAVIHGIDKLITHLKIKYLRSKYNSVPAEKFDKEKEAIRDSFKKDPKGAAEQIISDLEWTLDSKDVPTACAFFRKKSSSAAEDGRTASASNSSSVDEKSSNILKIGT